ncbi:MAG TPA: hypothetical protein VFP58_15205 [Candidatus Eisenbacteria bacterium]|nr:hypothetical protein [Candidatus Eisenbacteria bacterium]
MHRPVTTSRSLHTLFAAMLFLVPGCGEDPPTRPPAANVSVEPGTPVEIRDDADQVGMMDPITLEAASREGTNLKVTVSYGGCRVHRIRALVDTGIRESYPVTIYVYLQHDDDGERCAMAIRQELSYDARPIFDWLKSQGIERFSARVITPAVLTDPSASMRVLFEP